MSDLDTLKHAFDEIGVKYTVRECDGYQYLFVGERGNLWDKTNSFDSGDLEALLLVHKFYEFEGGKLASYSNS